MIELACDVCSKHSYLHATKGSLELDFCRHHGIEQSPALELQGWHLEWDSEGVEALTPNKVAV